MSKILVTGAAGFIGLHFATMRHFFGEGHEVVCTDKISEAPEGLESSDYMRCDLLNVKDVYDLIAKTQPDTIVHLAGDRRSGDHANSNFDIFQNVAAAAPHQPNIVHIVLAGSAAEYGDLETNSELWKEESQLKPIDAYGTSKARCSVHAQQWANTTKYPVTILRLANVYGPSQTGMFVPLAVDAVYHGNPVVLNARGQPRRQFVYVSDIARAIWTVVNKRATGIYNLGGEELSMQEMGHVVATAVHDFVLRRGIMPKPAIFDLRDGNGGAKRVAIDSTKAQDELGWTPIVNLYDGMRRVVASQLQGEINRADRTLSRAS